MNTGTIVELQSYRHITKTDLTVFIVLYRTLQYYTI